MPIPLIIGAGATIIGGLVGMGAADRQAREAHQERVRQQAIIDNLVRTRAQIIDPYETTENLSDLAVDLSGQLSNPYANLGVATQAAEIQMEQTDLALANTLDTLRATGSSAGGATALAQAALQSKKGVAASIEQQEAQNEKLKAQGEQDLQNKKMAEQQRLQQVAISEGQRVQAAEAAGAQFMFQAQENRTNMDLNRAAGLQQQAAQMEANANQNSAAALGGMLSGLGQLAGAFIGQSGATSGGTGGGGGGQNMGMPAGYTSFAALNS